VHHQTEIDYYVRIGEHLQEQTDKLYTYVTLIILRPCERQPIRAQHRRLLFIFHMNSKQTTRSHDLLSANDSSAF